MTFLCLILLGVPYTGGSLICHRLGASSSLYTLGRTLGAAADPQQQPALRLHLAAAALKQRCRRPFSCGAAAPVAGRPSETPPAALPVGRSPRPQRGCGGSTDSPAAPARPPSRQACHCSSWRPRAGAAGAGRPARGTPARPGSGEGLLQARLESLRKLVPQVDLVHAPNGHIG